MRRATTHVITIGQRIFQFQSTLSMRRATDGLLHSGRQTRISIHALHEESDGGFLGLLLVADISIHALHEESDCHPRVRRGDGLISIHALHEESDPTDPIIRSACASFQSTLSMRRATSLTRNVILSFVFQSTLSMRRATHYHRDSKTGNEFQSTLSMRRATTRVCCAPDGKPAFQSTLSMRRATLDKIIDLA